MSMELSSSVVQEEAAHRHVAVGSGSSRSPHREAPRTADTAPAVGLSDQHHHEGCVAEEDHSGPSDAEAEPFEKAPGEEVDPQRLSGCLSCIPRPGAIAMVVASACFSANTALAKLLSSGGTGRTKYSPFQILQFRGVCTVIGCSAVLVLDKQLPIPHLPDRRDFVGWATARGVLGAVAIGCLYFAVSALPLTEAVILYSLNPVFATIFSVMLLGEHFTRYRFFAVLCFIGGALLSVDPTESPMQESIEGQPASVIWTARGVAVFGSLCSGSAIVCARKLSLGKVHYMGQAWWQGSVSALLAPLACFLTPFQLLNTAMDAVVMLAMGTCAFLGQVGVGVAVRHENAAIVGVLWNLDIVFSFLWQATLLDDPIEWYQGVGVCFVVAASLISVAEKVFAAPPPSEDADVKGGEVGVPRQEDEMEEGMVGDGAATASAASDALMDDNNPLLSPPRQTPPPSAAGVRRRGGGHQQHHFAGGDATVVSDVLETSDDGDGEMLVAVRQYSDDDCAADGLISIAIACSSPDGTTG